MIIRDRNFRFLLYMFSFSIVEETLLRIPRTKIVFKAKKVEYLLVPSELIRDISPEQFTPSFY